MKKLFLLLTLLAITIIQAQAQVQSQDAFWAFYFDEDINEWEFIDGNNDNNTWQIETDSEKAILKYSAKKGFNDDYIKSKFFYINEKRAYTLHFQKKNSKGMEYFIALQDKFGFKKLVKHDICTEDDTDFSPDSVTFDIDNKGDYQLVFSVNYLDVEEGTIEIKKLSLGYPVRPETSITLTDDIKSGYRKKSDVINITVVNNGNGVCNTLKYYYTVNGGTPVYFGENAGYLSPGTLGYIDCPTITYDTYGTYNIEIVAKSEGDTIQSNDTIRLCIENREYAEMPFYEDYENIDYEINKISSWYNKSRTWIVKNSETEELYKDLKDWGNFLTTPGADNSDTGWMFLPPVKLEPGYYALEFDFIDPMGFGVWMDIYYGKEATIESMVNLLGETDYEGKYKSHAIYPVYISETQDFFVGMHSDYGFDFMNVIDNVSIKPIEKPAPDADLIYVDCGDYSTMRDGFFNSLASLVINRSMDKTITVTQKLESDGELVYEVTDEITPLYKQYGVFPLDLTELTGGRHIYSMTVSCDEDTNPNNNYAETEVLICKDPYLFYDFENGMPEGVKLIVADEGTSVTDPENAAWYIDEKEGFKSNSKKSLTSTSDIGTERATADRWFIMPPVSIGYGDADLVWEDLYTELDMWDNDHKFEKYQVLISTTDASVENFKVIGEYKIKKDGSQLRRLILDEFAGNTVYIAFRLFSDCGQSMSIDNIGLYGDFEAVHTSINEVAENSINVTVKGDMINVGAVAERIDVIDIDGRIIATANNSSSVNIASLSSGVYMARVNVNGTVNTVKFVR